jgi:hypothetical protein
MVPDSLGAHRELRDTRSLESAIGIRHGLIGEIVITAERANENFQRGTG